MDYQASERFGMVIIGEHAGLFVRMKLRNTFSSVVGTERYLRTVYSLDAAAIIHTVTA
jgi:hypothetical protein